MTGKLKDLTLNIDGSQNLTVTIHEDYREAFDSLKDNDINIEIKKASKRRSMDANNYFWHICGEIAKVSSKYSTDGKNDVYRDAIRAQGEYASLVIREDAIPTFTHRWSEKGTGWFSEIIDDYYMPTDEYSDVMGDTQTYKIVHAYYGSSTYDTASMSRIIDYVVHIATDLGIPTITDNEYEKLLSAWTRKKERNEQVNTTTE